MKKIILVVIILATVLIAGCSSDSKESDSKSSTTKASSANKNETSCGEPLLDKSKNYSVVFETTKGNITVSLDVENAPISTAHLAALVQDGFYNGLTFHRVVPDFVIQGGDPNGDGTGGPDCSVVSEEPPRPYEQGDFAWAKGGNEPAGTAGSQFFIVTGKTGSQGVDFLGQKAPQSDGSSKIQYGYAGKVTEGLDVALAIEALAPAEGDGSPTEKVTITKAELKS